jgi:S-adenosyl methyltransferase
MNHDCDDVAGTLARPGVDSRLSNVARIYDALLGGKDNYAADRDAARRLAEAIPDAPRAARSNRDFLARAVRYLAGENGISQFLDIGTGLPSRGHVHEIAQAVSPEARVVYADNDPVVIAHARALLADARSVAAVEADVRYPGDLLAMREVRELIDFSRPAAVLLVAVLHFVHDSECPWSAVKAITDYLAPGSFLVISHVTGDEIPAEAVRRASEIYNGALVRGAPRSRSEIMRFFDGLDLVPPGLVDVAEWRAGRRASAIGRQVLFWAGIGRKRDPGEGGRPASRWPGRSELPDPGVAAPPHGRGGNPPSRALWLAADRRDDC